MDIIEDRYDCTSVDLARYIISYANEHRYGINMTKLQKMLYICYGFYLAVTGNRLTNEHPQAWPYGPVFPTTRNKFLNVDFSGIYDKGDDTITDRVMSCVDFAFRYFGKYNASALTAWSHKPGSPWEKTTNTPNFHWGNVIPDEYILPYFESLLIPKKEDEE